MKVSNRLSQDVCIYCRKVRRCQKIKGWAFVSGMIDFVLVFPEDYPNSNDLFAENLGKMFEDLLKKCD